MTSRKSVKYSDTFWYRYHTELLREVACAAAYPDPSPARAGHARPGTAARRAVPGDGREDHRSAARSRATVGRLAGEEMRAFQRSLAVVLGFG